MRPYVVIDRYAFPARPPTIQTLVIWLVVDRLQAPMWGWTAAGTLVVMLWLYFLGAICGWEKEKKLPGFGKAEGDL